MLECLLNVRSQTAIAMVGAMVAELVLRVESVKRRIVAGCLRVRKIEVAAQVLAGIQKAKVELMQEGAAEMRPKIVWRAWTVPWMTTWALGRLLGQQPFVRGEGLRRGWRDSRHHAHLSAVSWKPTLCLAVP
jgi:hypothetical protein